MEIEFHYYVTGIIARRAGFSDAEADVIAHASQFVDDNDVILEIQDRSTGDVYGNYISQTMDILKPKTTLMRIYPIFHFIPGDPMADTARRRDGKMHLLNATPDNEIANALLSAAFKSPPDVRPYRIGIATHAYVDTWAHQNYAGLNDSFNGVFLNPIPNIGHAEAKHHPDWVAHRWEDDRLVHADIDNNLRFISAAKRLFEQYAEHLGRDFGDWPDLETDLLSIMGRSRRGNEPHGLDARMKQYAQLAPTLPEYDESKWFDEAIDQEVRGMTDSRNGIISRFTIFKDRYWWKPDRDKEDAHWFRFQEAVKEHQALGIDLINKLCARMGVDIRDI